VGKSGVLEHEALKLNYTVVRAALLWLLADRTAAQYYWLLASSSRPSVRPSVCDAVHCGAHGPYTRLKVAPACLI